jgi:hypothetical protein
VPLHRNDIVRLREPLGASLHLSDCVQVKKLLNTACIYQF